MIHTETTSPFLSSMDLLTQGSPSSIRAKVIPPDSGLGSGSDSGESTIKKECNKVQVKKQNMWTVLPQTQLCLFNNRFQTRSTLGSSRCKNFVALWTLATNRLRPGSKTREWNVSNARKATGQRIATVWFRRAQHLQISRSPFYHPGVPEEQIPTLSNVEQPDLEQPSLE
jgi:hypothetical protein